MRIEQEFRTIFIGERQITETKTPEEIQEGLEKGRVFSGKLQFPQDKIAERRRQAQEKAINIVKTAFAGELGIDDEIAGMEESIEKEKEEMLSNKAELNRVLERKAELETRNDLSEEEYRQELEELNKAESHFSGLLADGKKYEDRAIQAVNDIKLERLKSNPMGEAEKQAEKVTAEAGKEIVGMLYDEAKEHLDNEREKLEEDAEKKAEKEEELEERIEAMRAEKEEKEKDAPEFDDRQNVSGQIVKLAETNQTVQKELQQVVDQLKLDLEDLKGAAVDREI